MYKIHVKDVASEKAEEIKANVAEAAAQAAEAVEKKAEEE